MAIWGLADKQDTENDQVARRIYTNCCLCLAVSWVGSAEFPAAQKTRLRMYHMLALGTEELH